MITCFPHLYPDELFYSACARYADRVQYLTDKAVIEELFGSRTATATISFPSHLTHLIANLPPGHRHTVDRLIDHHSLLPFFSPFLQPEKVDRIREDMQGSDGLPAYLRSGITSGTIPMPSWLRYCPVCMEEDKRQFGKSYWHRLHQLPGVEVCPVHQVFLENSSVRIVGRQKRYELTSADRALADTQPRSLTPSDPTHEKLLRIAKDAAWLLQQPNFAPGLDSIRDRYLSLLLERGMATYSGKVRLQKLLAAFKQHYPLEFLQSLHCEIRETDKSNWLFRLVRPAKQSRHPLYHLLLIQFLGYTVEEFFALSADIHPFGAASWPCLNPICEHFHQPVIATCEIVYDKVHGGRITGIFTCNCDFSYARLGPDTDSSDRFRIGKVKAYGPLWDTKLQACWNDSTMTLGRVAQEMQADSQSIKRQAVRLGLTFPRPGPRRKVKNTFGEDNTAQNRSPSSKRDDYRAEWLDILQTHPKAGRYALFQQYSRLYNWLQLYDNVWLQHHLPERKPRSQTTYPLDWVQRDRETASEIRVAAQQLRNAPGKPVRVTKTALAGACEVPSLIHRKLDRLPLTAQAIAEVVDSRETYAIRRIRWVAAIYAQQGKELKRAQLLREAGIKSDLAEVPDIRAVIEKELVKATYLMMHRETVNPSPSMAVCNR